MTEAGGVNNFLLHVLEITALNSCPGTGNAGWYFMGFLNVFRQMPV
jgi:hypothetical protein